MKILITGGAGFMGSALSRLLASKNQYEIAVVDMITYAGDRERLKQCDGTIKFYQQNISNFDAIDKIFSEFKPDLVYNFAAHTHVDRSILESDDFITTNIIGTHNMLKACIKHQTAKYVQISTDEVYGELGNEGSFIETTPIEPNSPYSASKASADHLVNAYRRTYGVNTYILRCCNNFGPWQYPEKFIPVIIYKALNDEKIPVYARGENVREWIYVDDFARAAALLINEAKERIYNIGSGNEMKNINLVKTILKIVDKDESLIEFVQDRPGHDFRYSINSTRLRNEFNWKPEKSLQEGFELTVKWYKDNISWVERKIVEVSKLWKRVYKK